MLDPLLRQVLLLIQPIGFVWLCLLVLTVLLWRKGARGLAIGTAALALLMTIVGSTSLPLLLVGSLERPYLRVRLTELPNADAIVLLGGGSEPSPREIAGLRLTRAADRIITAVELMRLEKAPVLAIGGAGAEIDGELQLESELVKRWLLEWKLPGLTKNNQPPEIIGLDRCYDTHDEALKVRALAADRKWTRVLLVTSATHMARAEATFRTAGLHALPAPCNFHTGLGSRKRGSMVSIPKLGGFELLTTWLHEQVGWQMYRWRGWIQNERQNPRSRPP